MIIEGNFAKPTPYNADIISLPQGVYRVTAQCEVVE